MVVHRSQRHGYDRMVWAAGAKLVEIGLAYSTQPWELETAIGERTAGVFYTVSTALRGGYLPLEQVIQIAHARGVPVYVDAASMLPPAGNLQRFIRMGVDMVIFSGGKGIFGPQSTGILCGRRDLIEAAATNGSPYNGIGRAAKVSREEIVGLVTALELYVQRDHDADIARWLQLDDHILSAVEALNVPGVRTAIVLDDDRAPVPELHLTVDPARAGISASQIDEALWKGTPAIATRHIKPTPQTVVIQPQMLQDGEEEIIAHRLAEVLIQARQPVTAG